MNAKDAFNLIEWRNTILYEDSFREGKGELNVYGYETQHFDICPNAQTLYKDIMAGHHSDGPLSDKEEVIVKTLARLNDDLFKMEKEAVAFGEVDRQHLIDAEKIESDIYKLSDTIGLRDEHDYLATHIDRIATRTINEQMGVIEDIDDETAEKAPVGDKKLNKKLTKQDKVIKRYKDVQDKMKFYLEQYKNLHNPDYKDAAKEELKKLTPEFQAAKKSYEKIKGVKI
tara:strand:- start:830 stop:1513 length:684 start_codon:yes stop_codon:yes gene_type:complete